MSYNFQQDCQTQTSQKQDHSMGSLLFGAFMGGIDSLAAIDTALDTAEFIGEVRGERFQAEAQKTANNNIKLGMKDVIGGAFQSSVEGMEIERTKPQTRYLNYDFGYKTRPGMAMGMAA